MTKIVKIIILFGIFLLPLINSRITNLLWFSFWFPVNWNFEFTKVMFFNIWSTIVIFLFFIKTIYDKNIKFSNALLWAVFFYITLIFSTFFSTSPYISFFWNELKWHSFFMWSNLVGVFLVLLSSLDKAFFKSIINTFIISWIFVSIIGLKEYFIPTFDYWDLGNRLFSTFGHPNYVSIFLVSLAPFIYSTKKPFSNFSFKGERIAKFCIILLFVIALVLTKSVLAIFLFMSFNILFFCAKYSKLLNITKRYLWWFIILILLFVWMFFVFRYFPEKLHSFISRFFIWETSVKIIFSDFKLFLLWWWLETFIFYFDNFKSEYLYVFENLWFSADRPHNLLFNFFYHFWVLWFIFICWIYWFIIKNILSRWSKVFNSTLYSSSLLSLGLILFFLLLNPTSVVLYIIIIVLLAFIVNQYTTINIKQFTYIYPVILFIITLLSLIGGFFSYKFYVSEVLVYQNKLTQAKNIYPFNSNTHLYTGDLQRGLTISGVKTPSYFLSSIYYVSNNRDIELICWEYTSQYNYAEVYFSCWNTFWNLWEKEKAKQYYNKWLLLLPDLWNKDSVYYNKFLIKHFNITWNRFLSEKYGLAQILERVWIINE